MKISLNWLKEYIEITETPDQLAELLTQTGLEVESFEPIEKIPGGLEGVVIGEVMECVKHPEADKLKLTKVDIGLPELAPIVCGAPNVAVGQKVVVATVNSTIYPTDGEPLKIKKAKIRGEVSEGMICAEDEIGLGTSHAGIMILKTDLPNGTPAAHYFHPETDWMFEIGLTPNRGDAASHWGVARDIKAVTGRPMKFPKVNPLNLKSNQPIEVVVKDQAGAPRYSGRTIRNVEVKESPEWLKWRLRVIGLEPINNVVDVTNYLCHGLGQPMHAFDADKIKGGKVVVGTLPTGTSFVTLDEKERKLDAGDLMICDEKDGMCIAGVFGGKGSGITENTKHIFLESAYFSPEYIRNTVQRHGITTDASFRYERGADPEMTVEALKYATNLILEVAGGEVASEIIDIKAEIPSAVVPTTFANFHRLIGKQLPQEKIISILESLDIKCSGITESGFTATVPAYRNDVTREADLVEEVLRIYGFNNIELDEHVGTPYLAAFAEHEPYVIRRKISDHLAGKGFHEILTNSLVHPDYEQKVKVNDLEAIEIINKSSEELAYMKTSPVHSGLEVLRHNINRRNANVRSFEWAKTYHKQEDKYVETSYLCLFMTGDLEEENWIRPSQAATFQDMVGAIQTALNSVRIRNLEHASSSADKLFAASLELKINGASLGRVGWLQPALLKYFDIKQPVCYAELDWKRIMRNVGKPFTFEELPKFPEVRRDLSLVVDKAISFDRIEAIAFKSAKKLLNRVNVFSVYEGDKIEAGKKSYAVSYFLQDKTKTLNDKVIDQVMTGLMKDYENEIGAVIRK